MIALFFCVCFIFFFFFSSRRRHTRFKCDWSSDVCSSDLSRSGTFRAPESNTRTRTMFAVIKTGGKQYRVAAEDVLQIEKVKGDPGEIIQFGEVLLLGGDEVKLGAPTVAGASVAAEVLEQGRGPKVIAFKKRRRKNSRRKRGHRQEFTLVRVTEILTDGAKPTKTA